MDWSKVITTCNKLDFDRLKPTRIEGLTIWPQNKMKQTYSAYKARMGNKIAWFFRNGQYAEEHFENGHILDRKGNIIA